MTIERLESGEHRLAEALTQLKDLRQRVDDLSRRLLRLEGGEASSTPAAAATGPATSVTAPAADESVWSWLGRSRVLPRVAMISFALVAALVLRTLAESEIIGRELGVLLGIVYPVVLIAWGWRLLAAGRRGRRVLPACGVVLLGTVVLEAYGSFHLLSSTTANWILVAALCAVAGLGLHYRAGSIVALAVVSTSVCALALGFPHPYFPQTATVLLGGVVVAALGQRIRGLEWLCWVTFGLVLFLWLVWGFQANAALRHPNEVTTPAYLEWYVPFLLVTALLYVTLATIRARAAPDDTGAFLLLVAPANVLWAYGAALAVVLPRDGDTRLLGAVGCVAAVAHFGIAVWLWRRSRRHTPGVAAFALAGTLLFSLATLSVLGSFVLAMPVWAALAVGLMMFSSACESTGLRLVSYLFQGLVCVLAVTAELYAVPAASLATSLVASGTIAALSFTHYRLARTHPRDGESWISRFDRSDRTAIVLLWAAAVGGFGFLRLLVHVGVQPLSRDVTNAFGGAQSVIVNGAAIALMLWGSRSRNPDVLATSVLVALFGGFKVVFVDLPSGHGLPLVLAVSSFGTAAAVGSIVLGRWLGQRTATATDAIEPPK